jgi:DNA-binding NarL/FixJ family response regulator
MPKIFQISLAPEMRRQLESIRRRSKDARTWKRATAILLSARGTTASAISALLGVSLDTVSDFRRNWLQRRTLSIVD